MIYKFTQRIKRGCKTFSGWIFKKQFSSGKTLDLISLRTAKKPLFKIGKNYIYKPANAYFRLNLLALAYGQKRVCNVTIFYITENIKEQRKWLLSKLSHQIQPTQDSKRTYL